MPFPSPVGGLVANTNPLRPHDREWANHRRANLSRSSGFGATLDAYTQILSSNQAGWQAPVPRERIGFNPELSENSPELMLRGGLVQTTPSPAGVETGLEFLESLIGVVEAPEDWAAEHDHYLYGSPRRHER